MGRMTPRQVAIVNVLEKRRYVAACELIREYDLISTMRDVGIPQELLDQWKPLHKHKMYDEATHNLFSYRQMLKTI